MKKYNNWSEWYMQNEADEAYKNYYYDKQKAYQNILEKQFQEEQEELYNETGMDLATFANDIVEGITVKDNKIVFNGNYKKTKTYSLTLAERIGKELGKELGKLPGLFLNIDADKRKRK